MTVGSLFTGIGGFDLGLQRAGMQVVWQVEIDRTCKKVLQRHWPGVRRYGDIRTLEPSDLGPVDLVCGGFPCQDLSVAGRRAGLAGPQSSLYWEFHRLIAGLAPRWILVENVPGLLSSRQGRDFRLILDSLVELGYSLAWRILDAQFYGVAQRRRRVFIAGRLGKPFSAPAAVLFEPSCLPGDPPPRRAAGPVSATLVASGAGTGRPAGIGSEADFLVPILEVDGRTNGDGYRCGDGIGSPGDPMFTLQARHQHAVAGTLGGSGRRGWPDDLDRSGAFVVSRALTSSMQRQDASVEPLVINWQSGGDVRLGISDTPGTLQASQVPAVAMPLRANRWGGSDSHGDQGNVVVEGFGVRRLTPLECERLQGFPDGWTEGHSDSARYRMLGNAVAVPVAEWIGKRILAYEAQQGRRPA